MSKAAKRSTAAQTADTSKPALSRSRQLLNRLLVGLLVLAVAWSASYFLTRSIANAVVMQQTLPPVPTINTTPEPEPTPAYLSFPKPSHPGDYTTSYYLVADRSRQAMTVYTRGENGQYTDIVRQFAASIDTQLQNATYLTGDAQRWRQLDKGWSPYAIAIGNTAIHAAFYQQQDARALIAASFNCIGQSAYGEGITLAAQDAVWLYEHITVGTPLEIVEGDGSLADALSLQWEQIADNAAMDPSDPNYPGYMPTHTPAATPSPTPKRTRTPQPTLPSTMTPQPTQTQTPAPTSTPTATPINTPSQTEQPTPTATPTPVITPTATPFEQPTPTITPEAPTATPADTPQLTDTPQPTDDLLPTDNPQPTDLPTAAPTEDILDANPTPNG